MRKSMRLVVVPLTAIVGFTPVTAAPQTGMVTAGRAPDFAGTAFPISPVSSCSQVMPREVRNPPGQPADKREFALHGCWQGRLAGQPFFLGRYQSTAHDGGGLSVQHGKPLTAWLETEAVPHIVRFTRDYVCVGERGNSYWRAIDIVNGELASETAAVELCHFRTSDHLNGVHEFGVLGLKDNFDKWGPACKISQLSAENDQKDSDTIDGGAGHHAITIAVQNRSSSACVLHGVPAVNLSYYPSGRRFALRTCANCDDYLFSHQIETVILLKPQESAYVVLGYDGNDGAGACTEANSRFKPLQYSTMTLGLYPPDQKRTLGIRFHQWRSCGVMDVTPFLNHPPTDGSLPREP